MKLSALNIQFVDKTHADIFYGADGWLDNEWVRVKLINNTWRVISKPTQLFWKDKKGNTHTVTQEHPKGKLLGEIINRVKEAHNVRYTRK